MKWSKFNYLYYSSKHNKSLLYNSLSNTFVNVSNPELEQTLIEIRDSGSIITFEEQQSLFEELKKAKIIVESDETEILKIKHRLFVNRYSPFTINLTVLPTLSCIFRCPYCFTKEGDGTFMDQEVSEKIIKLVDNLSSNIKSTYLHLAWMGGEPLLNFNIIKELTERLQKMDITIDASIVTNGYLMTKEKIEQFKELNIRCVQITIDGLNEEHNATRIHKNDVDSFSKIISNMDTFFRIYDKRETVAINVRVNLDRTKDYLRKFVEVYKYLRNRYPYKNLFISPGFIDDIKSNGSNLSCLFDKSTAKDFFVDIIKLGFTEYSLYPDNQVFDCAVKSSNSFVIGPKGELYSCWENIGHNDYITGYINEKGLPIITNEESLFRYLIDADFLNDPKCLDCFFFPICTGGCPEKRIRNKHCNACFDVCMMHKTAIEEILDLHYEVKQKRTSKNEKT